MVRRERLCCEESASRRMKFTRCICVWPLVTVSCQWTVSGLAVSARERDCSSVRAVMTECPGFTFFHSQPFDYQANSLIHQCGSLLNVLFHWFSHVVIYFYVFTFLLTNFFKSFSLSLAISVCTMLARLRLYPKLQPFIQFLIYSCVG